MTDRPEERPKQEFRTGATWRVGTVLGNALLPAARKRGFAEAALLADWPLVVGPVLAERCRPVRIQFARGRHTGGILDLQAGGGAALELQHAAPQIVERINGYFGFAAVARLRLTQAVVVPQRRVPAAPVPRALEPVERHAIDAVVSHVADEGLREALARLGAAVRKSRPAR